MDINLTKKLQKKFVSWPRTRGRYSSSEIYGILQGWTTPEQWLNPPEKAIKDILNMWNGTGMHNQLEALIGPDNCEEKRTYTYKGITLVGKADYLPPHKPHQVWEFKTSVKTMEKSKPWHDHQVKLYATMFERDEGVIFQPVQNENGLFLKELGVVKRDDKWMEAEMEKLYRFHLKVEKLWEAKK